MRCSDWHGGTHDHETVLYEPSMQNERGLRKQKLPVVVYLLKVSEIARWQKV